MADAPHDVPEGSRCTCTPPLATPTCPCCTSTWNCRQRRSSWPTSDQLLHQARARLRRLDPYQAAAVAASGGLLVDIRPAAQRAEEGEIPGALIIERNVLEWRLDPASPHRVPKVQGHDQPIVILCSEGYTSSLAAAVLQDLGLHRATDLIGGFKAWEAGGLAVTAGPGR